MRELSPLRFVKVLPEMESGGPEGVASGSRSTSSESADRFRRRLGALAAALRPTGAAAETIGDAERSLRDDAALLERGAGARSGLATNPYENWSGDDPGITRSALVTERRTDLLPTVSPGPEGLSDADVRGFCARGFIVIAPNKSPEFHRANLEEFDANEGNYGGNKGTFGIHMDGLSAIYADDAVQSALRSLLGPNPVMHQHNATHRNGAGATNQSVRAHAFPELPLPCVSNP